MVIVEIRKKIPDNSEFFRVRIPGSVNRESFRVIRSVFDLTILTTPEHPHQFVQRLVDCQPLPGGCILRHPILDDHVKYLAFVSEDHSYLLVHIDLNHLSSICVVKSRTG